jgi:hypothetical protein
MSIKIGVVIAIIVIIGGLAVVPSYGQATTSTIRLSGPISDIINNSCGGEDVQLSGTVNFVIRFTQDANGGLHNIIGGHTNFQGVSGIGLTTGDKYIFSGGVNDITNIREVSASEFTFLTHGRLISQGSELNQLASSLVHATLNANGEITVVTEQFKFECTG